MRPPAPLAGLRGISAARLRWTLLAARTDVRALRSATGWRHVRRTCRREIWHATRPWLRAWPMQDCISVSFDTISLIYQVGQVRDEYRAIDQTFVNQKQGPKSSSCHICYSKPNRRRNQPATSPEIKQANATQYIKILICSMRVVLSHLRTTNKHVKCLGQP